MAVFAAGVVSILLSRHAGEAAAIWLPNALVAAALLGGNAAGRVRALGASGAAILLANVACGDDLGRAALFVVPNLVEASCGAALARLFGLASPRIHEPRSVALLLGVMCLVAPLSGATIGALLLSPGDFARIPTLWTAWYVADSLGMISLFPAAVTCALGLQSDVRPGRALARLVVVAVPTLVAGALAIEHLPFPLIYAGVPLVFGALLLDPRSSFMLNALDALCLSVALHHSPAAGGYALTAGTDAGTYGPLAILLLPPIAVALLRAAGDGRQRKLEDLETRWKFALEGGGQAAFDVDLVRGSTYYSDAWKRMLGYAPDEVSDAPEEWSARIHPDDFDRVMDANRRHLAGETAVFEAEFRMRHRDGSYVWILDRCKVVERDAQGRAMRLIGTHTDVSPRKIAESERAALATRLAVATEASRVGIWEWTVATDALLWDERMFELYGLSDGKRTGTPEMWRRAVHPEDLARVEAELDAAMSTKSRVDTEYRIVRGDGEVRFVRMTALVSWDSSRRACSMIGTNWDTTEIHTREAALLASETALKASEARLRTVVDNMPALIAYIDRDERYEFASRLHGTWFRTSVEDMVGRTVREIVGDRNYDEIRGHIRRALLGEEVHFEREVETASGPRWISAAYLPRVDDDGSVTGYYAIGYDRTGAQQAKLSQIESERRLQTVITNVPALLGYWNQDGRCVFGNRSYAEWFGIEPERLVGMTPREVLGEALYARNASCYEAALRGERQSFERSFVDRFGVARTVKSTFIPDIAEGRQRGFFVLGVDVTELDRAVAERTRELVDAKNAAERATRVKDEIVSNVSHEMRTPLHSIISFARLGIQKIPGGDEEKIRGYLDRILQSGRRLAAFVDGILDVARLNAGETKANRSPTNLAHVVRTVIDQVRPMFDEKRLTIRFDETIPHPVADVDPYLIERVLLNLLSNARKFSPTGGIVEVSIGEAELPSTGSAPTPAYRLTLSDQGPGIPEDELAAIFDPFVQSSRTDKRAGGTGLGLSICRELVILHGGTIRARNADGGGAELEVVLPREMRGTVAS